MTASGGESTRRLLPRWRPWRTAGELGELHPLRPEPAIPESYRSSFDGAERSWRRRRDVASATEFLAAALHIQATGLDRSAIAEASEMLSKAQHLNAGHEEILRALDTLREGELPHLEAPPMTFSVSRELLAEQAHAVRQRVQRYPRNALTRVDFARSYFALDEDEKAEKQLRVALALDPDNRFIVRSASRFYIDVDEERSAAQVIANARGKDDDPWLLSVSVGLRRAGRHVRSRTLQGVVDDRSLDPWHVSELAASLATREYREGNTKRANRLILRALEDPTENVAAHMEWARATGIRVPEPAVLPSGSFEALARRHGAKLQWAEAVEATWGWLSDEPFSEEAAGRGSLYAIEAEEYNASLQMTEIGLIASPGDPTLLNNRAFALACLWRLDEAVDCIALIEGSRTDASVLGCVMATAGLVLYRGGDQTSGRAYYERSIDLFLRHHIPQSAAKAAMNLAAEDLRTGAPERSESFTRAESLIARAHSAEIDDSWERLLARQGIGLLEPVLGTPMNVDPSALRQLPLINPGN